MFAIKIDLIVNKCIQWLKEAKVKCNNWVGKQNYVWKLKKFFKSITLNNLLYEIVCMSVRVHDYHATTTEGISLIFALPTNMMHYMVQNYIIYF